MSNNTNLQVVYEEIPSGLPDPNKTFRINRAFFDVSKVSLKPNEILIRTLYLSVDPYMRARMRDPSIPSYFPAGVPGTPFSGGAIGQVVLSADEDFVKGDVVLAFSTWEQYAIINTKAKGLAGVFKIPNGRNSPVPLSYYLGVLGMPGLTAYVGLHKICEPLTAGQTLYVSAASGAVGQVVGQYAKSLGLYVVGSAGSDDKVKYLLDDLKFDAAFNYKTEADLTAALKRTCPKGIDIYFENVGGPMLDAVLINANNFARIAVCGMISQYNQMNSSKTDPIYRLDTLIWKRIRAEGFIVSDDSKTYSKPALAAFTKLLQEGKMLYRESVTDGIENTPKAFVDMLQGKNFGKAVVKVGDVE